MTRREFIEVGAAFLGAAILGAVGGVTSTEDGRKRDVKKSRPSGEGRKAERSGA